MRSALTADGESLHLERVCRAGRAGKGRVAGKGARGPQSEAGPTQPPGKAAKAGRTSNALGYFILFYFTKWRQKLVSRVVSCFPSHYVTAGPTRVEPACPRGAGPSPSSHRARLGAAARTASPARAVRPGPDPLLWTPRAVFDVGQVTQPPDLSLPDCKMLVGASVHSPLGL